MSNHTRSSDYVDTHNVNDLFQFLADPMKLLVLEVDAAKDVMVKESVREERMKRGAVDLISLFAVMDHV